MLDQARIINLPDRAATVVIGNPLVADVSIVRSKNHVIADITGKSYGATNIIAMDAEGVELLNAVIEVSWPGDPSIVVVYRNVDRETYSCSPDCSRRLTLGDKPEFFNDTIGEIGSRNAQATGAAAPAAGH